MKITPCPAVCLLVAVCAVCDAGRRRQAFQNYRVSFKCRVRRVPRRVSRRVPFKCRVSPCAAAAAVCAVCHRVFRVSFRWTRENRLLFFVENLSLIHI